MGDRRIEVQGHDELDAMTAGREPVDRKRDELLVRGAGRTAACAELYGRWIPDLVEVDEEAPFEGPGWIGKLEWDDEPVWRKLTERAIGRRRHRSVNDVRMARRRLR